MRGIGVYGVRRFVSYFNAVRIERAGDLESISLQKVEVPALGPEEVLVKMRYSTINPSDINTAHGRYPIGKPPLTLGFEGSGTVVKSGGSALSDSLVGKNIAVYAKGTWAEYCVANSGFVYPLDPAIPLENAASLVINPMTVLMFVEKIRTGGHKAALQNPAASALGKMAAKYCKTLGIPIINLVRREEQAKILREIGAEIVVDTSQKDWIQKTREISQKLEASVAFDAVAGSATADISQVLIDGSVIYNYGTLSGEDCRISGAALRFRNQMMEGLWVTSWTMNKTYEERIQVSKAIQKHYMDVFATEYSSEVSLHDIKTGILRYTSGTATGNKILIKIC